MNREVNYEEIKAHDGLTLPSKNTWWGSRSVYPRQDLATPTIDTSYIMKRLGRYEVRPAPGYAGGRGRWYMGGRGRLLHVPHEFL